ncbi:Putative protein [Zobellia galactanivorans]|uniref:Uncharacterized protein n=1 Tax=Zobellia galactanivorans (strain DSM 12802 / CCUG 47099 / CIP 106680 / NCIMB 13871 / Dsij) TaxID=63186 RepID=G0L3S3_ZOBGA|nr:Putative protein [Zobellia galactanivorans]
MQIYKLKLIFPAKDLILSRSPFLFISGAFLAIHIDRETISFVV